jgi:hypothetical protein
VHVIQPGIVDTSMSRRISKPTDRSPYPHVRRIAGFFTAALQTPVAPTVVAEKIRDILANDETGQLRHPVGPDAEPSLQWRAAMTDEQWVEWGALDDEAWYQRVERDFALNARQPT